jgi:hypothetical protein
MVSAAALERLAEAAAARPACSPAAAMGVYAQLAVFASQQGTASAQGGQRCTVTVAELAARCRMGRRTVHTYLALIAECGLVAIDHRFDARGHALASTLVFAYPGRDAPVSPVPPAAHAAPAGAESVGESGADSSDGPRETRAAGGTPDSERGEEKEILREPGRGPEVARAILERKFGWQPRPPGGQGVPSWVPSWARSGAGAGGGGFEAPGRRASTHSCQGERT